MKFLATLGVGLWVGALAASTPVRLSEWGLDRLEQVRHGELTVAGSQAYLTTLRSTPEEPPVASSPAPVVPPAAAIPPRQGHPACWIWNTSEHLAAERRADTLAYLQEQGVEVVFVQSPAELDGDFATLVASLTAAGLQVQALEGSPQDILPEHRDAVLARLDRLLASDARAHRTGLHYDLEPYLIPGFGGARRAELLEAYLSLVRELGRRVHAAGLELTLSVPVWFDGALLAGLLNEVDHLALMDYRTDLEDILESARTELDLAAARGRTVWVGLETTPLPDETGYEFGGPPRHGPPESYPVVAASQDGDSAVFWLAMDAPPLYWPVLARHEVKAERLSFAGRPRRQLTHTLQEVSQRLATHPAFAGWAVHDLTSWKRL